MINQVDYILQIASRLQNFERKSSGVYNFRCPYCGDSVKNRFKARGYLYPKNNEYFYRCFNCPATANLYGFLEFVDPLIAKEFMLDKFKNNKGKKTSVASGKISAFDSRKKVDSLPTISSLHDEHSAKKYLKKRMISDLDKIFYCANPKDYVKKFTDAKLIDDDPKILFPLKNEKGADFGFVLRSIDYKAKNRYQTIIFDDREVKSYGQECINKDDQTLYVVEGIMDSLCLENSIAALDAALHSTATKLGLDKEKTILIFDNEPRNKWVNLNIEKAINDGWNVFIWPKSVKQKDLNECLIDGVRIDKFFYSRTFKGQRALLEFYNWRIC